MSDEKQNACCNDDCNLSEPEELETDLTCRKCKVCGCRHFEMVVDPAELGLIFK